MDFIKKAVSWLIMGAFIGTGFTGAMIFVSYLSIDKVTKDMEEKASSAWITEKYGPDSGLRITEHQERKITNGVEILGVVENSGTEAWSGISVEVELFDPSGQFVDECSGYIRATLKPGDAANFKVSCRRCDETSFPDYEKYSIGVVDAYHEDVDSGAQ